MSKLGHYVNRRTVQAAVLPGLAYFFRRANAHPKGPSAIEHVGRNRDGEGEPDALSRENRGREYALEYFRHLVNVPELGSFCERHQSRGQTSVAIPFNTLKLDAMPTRFTTAS